MNLTPKQIITYRYNNDFSDFGGIPPDSIFDGGGVSGKNTARGLEQHYHEANLADNGNDKTKVANKQNPVGEGNKKKDIYEKAAEKRLKEEKVGSDGCSKVKK
ncbi:hypothetical protein HX014_15770 [Myroides marinus]|uniref:hypothetical protein n=1 Tax=Myroides marinus TaxID=703342 RepID=UPI002575DC7F|nr:hypothetical protein [Myroides marinus]MDM1352059.1 hypothetical protein [Myroides marinus]MDM1359255.1 hypothetical protein [Myroides marinus]